MLTLAEAAARLGLERDTLRRQVRRGKLRARKVGPIWTVSEREVERYARENRRTGIRPGAYIVRAHYMAELTTVLPYRDLPDQPQTATCECGWIGLAVDHEAHQRKARLAEARAQSQ